MILIALTVIGGVAAYGVPLAAESANTTCSALEKRVFGPRPTYTERDLAGLGRGFLDSIQGVSSGKSAAIYARSEYPSLPTDVGCVALYWRTFMPGEKPSPLADSNSLYLNFRSAQ